MDDMYLSTDDRVDIQIHLQELSKRISTIIILIVILTLIWSISIDQILKFVLSSLDPCMDSCVNIFSPEEWAGTRWLSAGLLAIFTAGPFIILQVYSFAKPGLLPSERIVLVSWMSIFWLISFISILYTLTELLPTVYQYGHSFNQDTGLTGKYDAAEMLKISIAIAWTIILILAASSIIVIAGFMKLLWSGNAEWWRLRIHGMMLMLIWLILPNDLPGLFITLTIIAITAVEFAGFKHFRSPMPIGYGLKDLMNSEGRIQRILYADCSCCGVSPKVQALEGMGIITFQSVCRNEEEQNILLDSVMRFNVNQVIFSGCLIESLPFQLLDSLRFLGCEYRTLNLAHLSTLRTNNVDIDYQIAMSLLINPWSESQMLERCMRIILENNINSIFYGDNLEFGLNLNSEEAWITSPTEKLLEMLAKNGISINRSSN